MDLELEDEDVRIAVRALGAMRSGAGAPPVPKGGANFVFPTSNSNSSTITHHQQQQHQNHTSASTSTNPSTSHTPALSLSLASEAASSTQAPRTPPAQDDEDNDDRELGGEHDGAGGGTAYPTLARMQSLPLVSGALRVYEAGKANSRVVQYTSSLVSTSLRHASSRLPAGSGERIDEFAGGMLDRLDKYRRPSPAPPPASTSTSTSTTSTFTSTSATLRRGHGRPGPYDERGYVRPSYEEEDVDVDVDAEGERDDDEDGDVDVDVDVDAEGERDDEDGDGDGRLGYDGQGEGRGDGSGKGKGKGKGKRRWVGDEAGEGQVEGQAGRVPGWLEGTSSYSAPDGSSSSTNGAVAGEEREEHRQVAQRSRWQAVLLEAGGLSAALSDESMRRLRYCLQWLQYATQHIDSQILVLREFIASLHPLPPAVASSSSSSSPSRSSSSRSNSSSFALTTTSEEPTLILTPDHLRTLAHLRSDIVHTIRQVVGVVSKYAGGALPEPARGRVRGFILDLPKRFGPSSATNSSTATSSAIGVSGVGGVGVGGGVGTGTGTAARRGARRERGVESVPASPTGGGVRPLHPHSAAHSSRSHSRRGSTQGGASGVEPGKALAAAQRVLTLATESLDMMRGVTAVVGDSLDRADAWVDRLRTVGIQRGMDGLALPPHPPSHNAAPPPPHASHAHNAHNAHWAAGGSPAGYPYSGAGSPGSGLGLGGMSLGEREEEGGAGGGTPAGERDERERDERERDGEGRMEVDG
ncbi:transcription factor Opi1-domain-containing protein [Mycena filopes]|nr:transcription factor Opi1-domain-containing protein [Mycena filopes]